MKKLILAVDDNTENLKMLGSILQKNNLKTAFAKSGRQALEAIERNLPDLILLDIMMPDMDGYEVCKNLKANIITKGIPIIFLTAKADTEDVINGLELGAVDYVTKPFQEGELMTRINVHLKLKETEAKLQQIIIEKDRFFSIVAHDLGNVFTGSLGAIPIILEPKNKTNHDEMLLLLQKSLDKGYSLLRNLLYWSRSQTDRLEIKIVELRMSSIINQNLLLLVNNAQAKNITMTSAVDEEIQVFADEYMLNTIIRNLLSNAIKFTPKNGQITISSKVQSEMVEIAITDTGVGIAPEDIEKLFRLDISHSTYGTEKEEGTGLGLLLCKEFIEKNNGTIGIESTEGQGSRLYIQLPIVK